MRILVSGSTGFLGTALGNALQEQGHEIARLLRPGSRQGSAGGAGAQDIAWDPVAGQFGAAGAEGSGASAGTCSGASFCNTCRAENLP